MMTVPTVKTVILILKRIRMMTRTKNYISYQSHDWDYFYSLFLDSSCYSLFSNFALTSRPAGLLVNLDKLLTSE